MTGRAIAPFALLLAAALVAPLPATAQSDYRLKPGASGRLCVGCHDSFEETLRLASVHTPVRAGECVDCHNPHAAEHGMLLVGTPEGICGDCHDDIVPEDARSIHGALLEGGCVTCHDPHASENRNNLVAGGNELCASCHSEIAETATTVKFKHPPVEQDCLGCHDPHASTSDALLATDLPGLCIGCHDTTPAFKQQHMGYPVEQADCTTCHNPHGSNSGAILWANVHRPVGNRMCDQCHEAASSPNALETKRQGYELCRACHNDTVNEAFALDRVHWPVVGEGSCANCHNPHASPHAALLAEAEKPLCGSCHAAAIARQDRSLTKHTPIDDGECSTCHSAHSSNAMFLLQEEEETDLCGACHDWQTHSTHPIGPEVVDMRNQNLTMSCSSCHRVHGTEHKHMSHFDPSGPLCVECHEQFGR